MLLTLEELKQCVPLCTKPDVLLPYLNHYLVNEGLITPLRQSHFLAQVAHESSNLNVFSENLNYSAAGLLKVFAKYFPHTSLAVRYARNPEAIANRVYANRMGNGDEASGDGWRYRGAGLIQLTGKNNHESFADASERPLEGIGDYLRTPEGAVHSAVWFWRVNGLNALADRSDIIAITRRINGGLNGLADRQERFQKIIKILGR